MVKFEPGKWLAPAAILTLVLLGINFVLSYIGYPVAPLYSSIGPVSAVSGTVGQKALGWLGGIIPIGQFFTEGTIILFLSAYLILLAGAILVSMGLPVAKTRTGKLASTILWGSALFYVVIVGFVMKSWNVLLGLALHTVVAAYATGWLADKFNVKID